MDSTVFLCAFIWLQLGISFFFLDVVLFVSLVLGDFVVVLSFCFKARWVRRGTGSERTWGRGRTLSKSIKNF